MKYYTMNIKEVLLALDTKIEGLSDEKVQKRLSKYGKNAIINKKEKTNISKFINEFKDFMIIMLIISAITSFIISIINNESITDSIIIILIVILNAILGFIQELKADKAINSLKKMQITTVKVKRNNQVIIVDSKEIVKGDIIIFEAGDIIPADCRIIWSTSTKVDESTLTGESFPVSKDTKPIQEDIILSKRSNMLYTGTNVVYGKCTAVVCETGMNTELGKISKEISKEESEITPLQQKINGISKFLSIIIFIIISIMLIIGLIKGMQTKEIIMLSISLAVAAIPEGLPAIITIILSLGMKNMAQKKAIVRKMSSVETLGSTEIICTDKTGTITENKMKVVEVYFDNKISLINELKQNKMLIDIMALNNDVVKNDEQYIGDPTEIALYKACEDNIDINILKETNKRINELPFDSERKMMSVIIKNQNKIKLYTKGSFDSVIKRCTYIYTNSTIKKITKKDINELIKIEKAESEKGYRVLSYAMKNLNKNYKLDNLLEENLIFVGLSAMTDPPRSGVKNAIKECKKAKIRPIMITGDSLATAIRVAKEIGILKNDKEAITGEYLDKMSEEELRVNVNKYNVYARVSPINKLNIVKAWKENKKIVAMTGDGVNDAPALKIADIGVGMGISGTEVAKNVSDIILVDDSFSTIVTAVKEGRRIYDNIRNVLVYLITGNIAEVLIVFLGMLFGVEIFMPIQLLYINLITDSIPAISLAFEECNDNIMNRDIKKRNSSFFTPFLLAKMGLSAILKTITVLLIYFINLKLYNIEVATTMAFLSLILLEIIFSYTCKNLKRSVVNKNILNNKYMNNGIIILALIQIIIFISPLKNLFNIVSLNRYQVIHCFVVVLLMFLIDEISKKTLSILFKD